MASPSPWPRTGLLLESLESWGREGKGREGGREVQHCRSAGGVVRDLEGWMKGSDSTAESAAVEGWVTGRGGGRRCDSTAESAGGVRDVRSSAEGSDSSKSAVRDEWEQ